MKLVAMNIKDDDGMDSKEYDGSPCVYLNDDQVEALGIKNMPAPGTVFTLQARAVVRSVTATAEEPDEVAAEGKGPDISLTLCLTDIGIEPTSSAGTASALYGG